ncbi:MAG TPA: hypothetical protein VMB51_11445 [Solirubrobacteraceae bacterium]|nr:hypothetical protein [Solirubrobacteraceae bacterium]
MAINFASSIGAGGREINKAGGARNGKSYRFWQESQGPGEIGEVHHTVERVELNASGQLALAVAEEHTGQIVSVEMLAVESADKRRVLDSGPPAQLQAASLKLHGSTVQWIDAGLQSSAAL